MSTKQILESKYFKIAAAVSGVLLVALISFAAGVKVGFHKALFSSHFGENYERNFLKDGREGKDGRPGMHMEKMMDKGMRNAHGVGGEVLSIAGDSLVIKGRDNQESTVRVSDATIINRGKDTIALSDLKTGERVVVIGKPMEDGVVAAHLVRVFAATNEQ